MKMSVQVVAVETGGPVKTSSTATAVGVQIGTQAKSVIEVRAVVKPAL